MNWKKLAKTLDNFYDKEMKKNMIKNGSIKSSSL